MTASMKLKFDKYWGACNLLMAIASVLYPRRKFHIVDICFPLIYKDEVAQENIKKVKNSLEELYAEYVSLSLQESSSNEVHTSGINSSSSSTQSQSLVITGFDRIMNIVREKEVKSELQTYLDEGVYIPDGDNNALKWWRNNSLKYQILSKMAVDILVVPISTVASKSIFSVGGRVIDEYRSKLNQKSIEALICGGDWLRHKYNLKQKSKVAAEQQQEITLKI
ncbi:unnamed protein product [Vicia faba]|uniref:Uncharacterized protein n=1 Tax=Vicia faba TaxID=3906 RepID=A0AAV0Z9D3_VICFA|nr:unnamed protein product [Vicia faba]